MKTYKIKSLIYFSLFVVTALYYNSIEQDQKFQEEITSSEVVNIDTEQLEDSDSEDLDTPLQ